MSIGNHELIEFEQNNAEELAEEFLQSHEEEWEQFKKLMYGTDEEKVQNFCENHDAWGDHVLGAYSDGGNEDDWRVDR